MSSEENQQFSMIALGDGVSSCKNGGIGAQTACDALVELFSRKGKLLMALDKGRSVRLILSHITHAIQLRANADMQGETTYASTLAAVVYDKESGMVLVFSIGDSLILGIRNEKLEVVAPPSDSSNGCDTTTTQNVEYATKFKVFTPEGFQAFVIFSDGAWSSLYGEDYRMNGEAKACLIRGDFYGLEQLLIRADSSDDCSLIALQI
jgi:hypothetical protein